MERTDLLGRPLTDDEAKLLDVYRALRDLAASPELPPCADRHVKKALGCMWQAVNDLDLDYEQLYDVGV